MAVDAGDAGADRRRHVVKAEAVVGGHLGGGDLEIALAADDDDLVADRGVRHRGEVDAGVLERRRPDQGHRAAPYQDAAGEGPAPSARSPAWRARAAPAAGAPAASPRGT